MDGNTQTPGQASGTAPGQALRYNTGKPQLSYLLSFSGGVFLAFGTSRFYAALYRLGIWYRGEGDRGYLLEACCALLAELDPQWPELLSQVSMFGAKKYARGNYLKGMSWSVICDSLLRHVRALERGEEIDPDSKLPHDGHIAWNVLYLMHCTHAFAGTEMDDRLRAPVDAPASVPAATPAPLELNENEKALVRGGKIASACKEIRNRTGCLLTDALKVIRQEACNA